MKEETCCVTGHRDVPAEKTELVKTELRREILLAVEDGYTRFISGFAEGVDLMFAAIVAELMEENPALFLEAAIPYRNRLKAKDKEFQELINLCKGVHIECEDYIPNCFINRNRYMVSQSERAIAVYDGREKGGTLFTMRSAHSQGKELHVIEI